jgi:toxin FitB
LTDGRNAAIFAKPIEATRSLIVPTLSIFEVFKRVCQQRNEDEALRAVAVMEQGRVVDLDRATALEAARLSIQHAIAMADSVMLATAQRHRATFWTQDADFDGLPGARCRRMVHLSPRLTAGCQHQASQPAMRRICVESRMPHLRDRDRLGAHRQREASDYCSTGLGLISLRRVKERASHQRH